MRTRSTRQWIGAILRNVAQKIDPQPTYLSWTYHTETGNYTVTHWTRPPRG
jgi:hypothetical protein